MLKSYAYIRQRGTQPPKCAVITSQFELEAMTYIIIHNKFEPGNTHLLELVEKYYDNILDVIPDEFLDKLEAQNGLSPWTAAWWEQVSDITVSLEQILELGIKYKMITQRMLYKHITKKESDCVYQLIACDEHITI